MRVRLLIDDIHTRGHDVGLATIDAHPNIDVRLFNPFARRSRRGVERFQELIDRSIRVTVITNSLASTDNPFVHGGYVPSRKPLLKMGVELAEYRAFPDAVDGQARGDEDKKPALHTKAFVIDGERVFVGSFNFDPRSARSNTEIGVIIDSLARPGHLRTRRPEARAAGGALEAFRRRLCPPAPDQEPALRVRQRRRRDGRLNPRAPALRLL